MNNKNSEIEHHHRESGGNPKFERVLCPDEARVMQKANQIVMYVLSIKFFYCGGGNFGTYFTLPDKKLNQLKNKTLVTFGEQYFKYRSTNFV